MPPPRPSPLRFGDWRIGFGLALVLDRDKRLERGNMVEWRDMILGSGPRVRGRKVRMGSGPRVWEEESWGVQGQVVSGQKERSGVVPGFRGGREVGG